MDVVYAEGLSKRYGAVDVVDQLDLAITPGECFGLLGPNGAGKTTTLRMLLGLTPPDRGRLQVLGYPVPAQAREARVRMGVVPQFDNLDPDFTVRENLCNYANYFAVPKAVAARRVAALLEFVALEGRADAAIGALSGGMRRRVTLARALVNEPELVILDEPTTGLDPQARRHVWQQLRQLREAGRTLVLTSHYMEEAQRLCDRVAIMDQGRIVACAPPLSLITTHVSPHVVEVEGPGALDWYTAHASHLAQRVHQSLDGVVLYLDDPQPVLSQLQQTTLRYVHRLADLEDVFLHLTGHALRED